MREAPIQSPGQASPMTVLLSIVLTLALVAALEVGR